MRTSKRIDKGTLLIAFWGISIVVPSAKTIELHSRDFMPSWSIGSEWNVEVSKMTEPPSLPEEMLKTFMPRQVSFVFRLRVEALVSIDSENCYRLRIQQVASDGKSLDAPVEFWRIYLRQSDFTLKKVERLTVKLEKIEVSREFEAGPVDATDWVGFLPLACPAFAVGQAEQESFVRTIETEKTKSRLSDHCRQTEEITRICVRGKEMDALKITLNKQDNDGPSRRTTETWVKGMPWWVEATHYRDGRQWCSARLLFKD